MNHVVVRFVFTAAFIKDKNTTILATFQRRNVVAFYMLFYGDAKDGAKKGSKELDPM